MACNSCSKSFSLFRKEKGCPSCGFSYCSSCLKYKLFVSKLNSEVMVCMKCERINKSNEKTKVEPPDVYYKRIGALDDVPQINSSEFGSTLNPGPGGSMDQEISSRLQKLKEDTPKTAPATTEEVTNRLQKIKGALASTSDAELQLRLANLRGVPISTLRSKPLIVVQDNRTEQEQVEDLMKQYMEHAKIDRKYQDDLQGVLENIRARLQKLKNTEGTTNTTNTATTATTAPTAPTAPTAETKAPNLSVESEEDNPNKIIEKPLTVMPDNRTEQEQVEDLMKQYMEHAKNDRKYQDDLQGVLENIRARLQKLKNTEGTTNTTNTATTAEPKAPNLSVESEEDSLNKIIEEAKLESRIENEDLDHVADELPFCEICNEDAKMRCLGCKYLFCKQCFNEHKDDNDGCDKSEPYSPPKSVTG